METWDDLPFWSSLDWSNIQERYDALEKQGVKINPDRSRLFMGLDDCPFDRVKCCIIGQDPYPDPRLATGLAFSVPEDIVGFPPTLDTIFKEYCSDLHLSYPNCGDLSPWVKQGILLWNAIPSCESWKSLSHDWPEWRTLTSQIVEELCKEGVVFVLLGARARSFSDIINYYEIINPRENILIELCHPSPRASASTKTTSAKFIGSRLFTRINDALEALDKMPIDWRL